VPGRRARYVVAALAAISGLRPVIALATGAGVGMVMTCAGYSRLVFRKDQAA
jgi:hypothetical protein